MSSGMTASTASPCSCLPTHTRLVHQPLNCSVFIRVYFLSQPGVLNAKYDSIASEKQRSCGEKETEEIWRNLGVGALVARVRDSSDIVMILVLV
jgi:hypothetical protein